MAVTINGTPANYRNTVDATSQTATLNSVASGEGVLVITILNGTPTVSSVDVGSATGIGQIATLVLAGSLANDKWYFHWYPNSTQTGNLSVTVNMSGAENPRIMAFRLGGQDTGAYSGGTQTGTGNADDPSVSVTAAGENSAIFAACSSVDSAIAAGAGYTSFYTLDNPQSWYGVVQYDLDVGASGSKTVPFVTGAAEDYGIIAVEIKAAPSGVEATTYPGRSLLVTTSDLGGYYA